MKETKVVYNACFGGFGISNAARSLYKKKTGRDFDEFDCKRHDRALVEVVEELGSREASGWAAKLKIATVTGKYRIDEYDGSESVKTPDSYDWVNP